MTTTPQDKDVLSEDSIIKLCEILNVKYDNSREVKPDVIISLENKLYPIIKNNEELFEMYGITVIGTENNDHSIWYNGLFLI